MKTLESPISAKSLVAQLAYPSVSHEDIQVQISPRPIIYI